MKIICLKKILLFKIKHNTLQFKSIAFAELTKKTNIIFYFFGEYFKLFFDLGLNVFGTIPFWFSKVMGYLQMRDFFFYKMISITKKTTSLFKKYNSIFTSILKRAKQGFFIEFKIIGYFRAKRISLLLRYKKKQ